MIARLAMREWIGARARMRHRAVILAGVVGIACTSQAAGATYYVSAAATSSGDGSRAHPFGSLGDVEHASRAGDSIIVLPSPPGVPPLDGGIALKPRQRLMGAGPAVIGRPPDSAAPRIGNTRDSRLAGDAVRLADRTTVGNLVIVSARRAGVYGQGAADVRVENNDIAAANESCVPGLVIYFPPESRRAPLQNGFAAIMMDFDASRTSVVINDNFIHDSSCSDGIDVRAAGHADIVARIDGNVITRLKQGASVGSLLGIGLQTRDGAALTVSSSHNAQTYLGNLFTDPAKDSAKDSAKDPAIDPATDPATVSDAAAPPADHAGAGCEGVFTSQTGGKIVWNIDRNTFAHGAGGTSCHGAEFLVGTGAARLHVVVRDSIFEDNPGNMIEEDNFGTDSLMEVMLDNVTVRHTTGPHPHPQQREPPVPAPAFDSSTSRSDCLSQSSGGPRAVTRFAMTRSHFSDCAGDGILAFHANLPGPGIGPGSEGSEIGLRVDHSSITNVGGYALHFINYAALNDADLEVQASKLDGAEGLPAVSVNQAAGAPVGDFRIDLGGGVLGSLGLNCFGNPAAVSVSLAGGRTTLSYAFDWWGSKTGPILREAGGRESGVADVQSLTAAPPTCQTPAN